MKQHQEKTYENKTQAATTNINSGIAAVQLKDNRKHSVVQQKLAKKNANEESYHAPIQRKSNATGLPNNLKSGIENLSGHSMDDVKVHYNSSQPAKLNAHAYAQGSDIHLASGQEKHLPHEAWHVVQQKQGRVEPTLQMKGKVNINDDKGLENEADIMGAKALQSDKITTLKPPSNNSKIRTNAIQCRLIIGGHDYSAQHSGEGALANLNNYINAVYVQITTDAEVIADDPFLQLIITNQVAIKKQLGKWIENTPGVAGTHPDFGRKQQNRSYATPYELGKAVLGWVQTKPVRHIEKNTADNIYANASLKSALNSLLVKLYYKIFNLEKDGHVDAGRQQNIITELNTGLSIAKGAFGADHRWTRDEGGGAQTKLGHYQRYHRSKATTSGIANIDHQVPDNQLEILRNPSAYSIKNVVIILHDLMEYFGTHQAWNPITSGGGLLPIETRDETMVTTAIDPTGERTATVSMSDGTAIEKKRARGMGLTTSSRDERAPNTLLARQKGLPVWAGQSMTTVRMMKLAQWAGADSFENAALALSIFAYWRKDYDHTAEYAYHTMFEVLDVAKNFNVAYKMLDGVHIIPMIDLASMLLNARNKYQSLIPITQNLITRMGALQIAPPIILQLHTLFTDIKQEDVAVNAAYIIASDAMRSADDRNTNLSNIVIRLEIAVEKQKQIKVIIDAIPVPVVVPFDPDIFFA